MIFKIAIVAAGLGAAGAAMSLGFGYAVLAILNSDPQEGMDE